MKDKEKIKKNIKETNLELKKIKNLKINKPCLVDVENFYGGNLPLQNHKYHTKEEKTRFYQDCGATTIEELLKNLPKKRESYGYSQKVLGLLMCKCCKKKETDEEVGARWCLIGPPSSGKSTIGQELIETAQNKIHNFVSWILDFAHMDDKEKTDLKQTLYLEYCSPEKIGKQNKTTSFFKDIKKRGTRSLIVIDHFDATKLKTILKALKKEKFHKAEYSLDDLISLLWFGKLLKQTNIIFVARPHSIATLEKVLRPKKILFVDDRELAVGEKNEREQKIDIYKETHSNKKIMISESFDAKFTKTGNEIDDLEEIYESYIRSRHFTQKKDKSRIEKTLSKISFKKVQAASLKIEKDELDGLKKEEVQDYMITTPKQTSLDHDVLGDEDLSSYFISKSLQEFLAFKYLIEHQTEDEFTEFLDKSCFVPRLDQVETEDLFANIRKFLFEDLKSTKSRLPDGKKRLFTEHFVKSLKILLETEINSAHKAELLVELYHLKEGDVQNQVKLELQMFEFDQLELGKTNQKHVIKLLEEFVWKFKKLKINCESWDKDHFEKLNQRIIEGSKKNGAMESIEWILAESLGNFKIGELISVVRNEVTLLAFNRSQYEAIVDDVTTFDCGKLQTKVLDVVVQCKGYEAYTRRLRKKVTDGLDVKNLITHGLPTIKGKKEAGMKIEEAISNHLTKRTKHKIEKFCCTKFDDKSFFLPTLKLVDNYETTTMFKKDLNDEPYSHLNDISYTEFYGSFRSSKTTSVIVGPKGSGKTIIASRIILQQDPEYTYKVFINLDQFGENDKITLKQVLIENQAASCGFDSKDESEKLFESICEGSTPCDIILDSYDKAPFDLQSSTSCSVKDLLKPGNLFGNLVSKRLLPQANILLISRPYKITQLAKDDRPKKVYFVSSLSNDSVAKLFGQFCGRKSLEQQNYIKERYPLVKSLCGNPRILQMLTRPDLSPEVDYYFALKTYESYNDLLEVICVSFNGVDSTNMWDNYEKYTYKLAKFAFKLTMSSPYFISNEDFKNLGLDVKEVENLLLVSPQGKDSSKIECCFINPLFQAHFTARFLTEFSNNEELEEFLKIDVKNELFLLIRCLCWAAKEKRKESYNIFRNDLRQRIRQLKKSQITATYGQAADQTASLATVLQLNEAIREMERAKSENLKGIQELVEEESKISLRISNLYHLCEIFQLHKKTKTKVIKLVLSCEKIDRNEFETICHEMKVRKLKLRDLEVIFFENFPVATLKKLKEIVKLVEKNLIFRTENFRLKEEIQSEFLKVKNRQVFMGETSLEIRTK